MKINIKTTDAREWAVKFAHLYDGDVDVLEEWFDAAINTGWEAGRKVANENNAKYLFYRTHGHSYY